MRQKQEKILAVTWDFQFLIERHVRKQSIIPCQNSNKISLTYEMDERKQISNPYRKIQLSLK